MYELPLFPLNTVLFPGMPLRLHIFEERYKLMIGRCFANGEPFGVTLIRRGQEVGGRAEPFLIGCTAEITELEPLPGGRFNLVAVGGERFRILSLQRDKPYLTGTVETLPIFGAESEAAREGGRALRAWVQRYLKILIDASDADFDPGQLPGDPERLAYLAAFLLQVPQSQKQLLLEADDVGDLVAGLRAIYRREATLLQVMADKRDLPIPGAFSEN